MSEETIFHEVDEELRRDRLRAAWRRYGVWLIGAAVLIVLLVAANEGWTWYQNSNSSRSSDEFFAALDLADKGDVAGAQKALDALASTGTGQYPVLARFKAAGLLAKTGKKDEAAAAFDAIASSQSNQRLKELALLLAGNALVDKGDVNAVKSRVEGLLNPADPLHSSAGETLGLAQYKANDLSGARDSFAAVMNDPLASDETRGRMQLYIAELVALGATPPATTAQAGTAAGAAAAAVEAIGAAPGATPAPANDNAAPVGIESAQPSTPDSALDLAVPTAPATPDATQLLTNGAGLPTPTEAPAPAPAADTPAAATPATAAPAAGTSSATPASSSPAATAPAAATPAPAASTTPAPATGTSGQ